MAKTYRRKPQQSDGYTVGSWHGYPHYRCNCCPFDTMQAGAMMDHLVIHDGQRAGSEPAISKKDTEVSDGNSNEE
jgi:hypothetical protein